MKTVLWSMLCLFLSGWGSMQAVLAPVSYTHLTLPTNREV